MGKMRAPRMAYLRNDDPILTAVIAELNKSAVKPDPGFFNREEWAKKWKMSPTSAIIYLKTAIDKGLLVRRRFRVLTKNRLRLLDHFGPPDKPKNKKRS